MMHLKESNSEAKKRMVVARGWEREKEGVANQGI